MTLDKATLDKLRQPFPPEQIGHKPKGGTMIDFVGHAAVTDRLNTVLGGEWTYSVDQEFPGAGEGFGIRGTLWCAGVPRVEYGEGKTPKEALSDFLKRGAMRFGVALDLWSKEELTAPVPPNHGGEGAPDAASDGGEKAPSEVAHRPPPIVHDSDPQEAGPAEHGPGVDPPTHGGTDAGAPASQDTWDRALKAGLKKNGILKRARELYPTAGITSTATLTELELLAVMQSEGIA